MLGINPKHEYPFKVVYSMNGVTTNSKVFKTESKAESFYDLVYNHGGDAQRMWGEHLLN